MGPFRLDGRVALITGGGSEHGIGRAVGQAFGAAGAAVGLVDLDLTGAERNAAAIRDAGASACAARAEVTDPHSVAAARFEF